MQKEELARPDFCAGYQNAVVQVLVDHTVRACTERGCRRLCMAGGVSANSQLRASIRIACENSGIVLSYPPPVLCTDNAAMIASAGYFRYIRGERDDLSMNAYPSLSWFNFGSEYKEIDMARQKGIKSVADNRKAFHDYYIEEKFEAGIVLSVRR
jgi:tRNA A37 threonylcarbamoyltransferase TsaD